LNGGKLENSRIVESLTALLIGLNMRYRVHGAGIRFTGLPLKCYCYFGRRCATRL